MEQQLHDSETVVRCLGAFSAEIGGQTVRCWRAGKSRSLFQYLLVNEGKVVLKERLFEVLWPTLDWSRESSSLKVAVHALRRTLGSDGSDAQQLVQIAYVDSGYVLRLHGDVWVDFIEFEKLVKLGGLEQSRGNHRQAVGYYAEATKMYLGEFLLGESAAWVYQQREWMRVLALRAQQFLASQAFEQGDWALAIDNCRAKLSIEPADEAAYRMLMEIHAARGELGAVKRWYDMCLVQLQLQLDVTPARETTEVFQRAIRGQLSGAGAGADQRPVFV